MELWQVNEKYHVSQMDSFDDIDERELIESDIWNADIIEPFVIIHLNSPMKCLKLKSCDLMILLIA